MALFGPKIPSAGRNRSISQRTRPICDGDGLIAPCDSAHMTDQDALEQMRADIFEVFPPGPQRDVWLKWLAQLTADAVERYAAEQRILH